MALKLALTEAALLLVAVWTTTFVWVRPLLLDWLDVAGSVGQAAAPAAACTVAFYYNDLYDLRIVRSFAEFLIRLAQAFGVAFILLAGFYTVFPDTKLADGPFISSLAIVAGLLLPLRAVSYAVMRSRPFIERVLILGTGRLAAQIVEEIEAQPHFGYAIVGIVEDAPAPARLAAGYPLLGPLERIRKLIAETRPDRIVVTLAERRGRLPVHALLEARVQGTVVEDGSETYERLTGKIAIETLQPSGLVFARDFGSYRIAAAVGRATSLLIGLAGLVVCAPLWLLLAASIRLDSPGPVFFRHERIGLHGRRFPLIKFRTMRPASAATSEWARDNADRITRVGAWLRRFRLDELPQLVNMVRGDVNLVGPRPHPVTNQELFTERIPYYALRALVRPGVTGWAQVRFGYANDLDEEIEKMRYDLYYIKHLSPWLDLRILVDTVKIVLFGRGATGSTAYPAPAPARVEGR